MSQLPVTAWTPHAIVSATVRSVAGPRVELESASFGAVSARLAAPAYRPEAGDVVLVAAAEGTFFVIGVLRALREASATLIAKDGSRTVLEEDEDGAHWRVHDARGRLVFEHHANESVVAVPHDLTLRAGGDVAIEAGGEVRIDGDAGFAASTRGPLALSSTRAGKSSLELDGDRARLESPRLEAKTDRADLLAEEANVVAGTLRTVAHRVIQRAESVERTAGRVVDRAREVFAEVEELSQTKAGRLRFVASTALSLLGRRTSVKAEEDVKIDGAKIHLG